MPVIGSPSPNEKHDSRETAYGDMLSSAIEALRSQVTNTTYKLHAQQGPGSSRAFLSSLSTLYTLPNEDFARLCASIYRASTSCDPNTPSASDAGSSADSSEEDKTRNPGKGSREVKLKKFIGIAREALVQLVNQHWERLAQESHRMIEFVADQAKHSQCSNHNPSVSAEQGRCGVILPCLYP